LCRRGSNPKKIIFDFFPKNLKPQNVGCEL
jgi:hypothetical protein